MLDGLGYTRTLISTRPLYYTLGRYPVVTQTLHSQPAKCFKSLAFARFFCSQRTTSISNTKHRMASTGRKQPPWIPPKTWPDVELPRLKVYNSLTREKNEFRYVCNMMIFGNILVFNLVGLWTRRARGYSGMFVALQYMIIHILGMPEM